MGYNTSYSLKIETPDDQTQEAIVAILRQENEDAEYAFDEEGGCNNDRKWYDSTEELTEFSKRFPLCLFELNCQGEEGEQWTEYFKDGKFCMIEPVITWPKFDESMLE